MNLSFIIFGVQVLFSFLAFGFIFQKLLIPFLQTKTEKVYFFVLLIPHVFRHLGFTGLLPEVTDPKIPEIFANTLALGDLITLLILYLLIWLLSSESKFVKPVLWLFSIIGIIHLSAVIFLALSFNITDYQLGFVWIVATFYAPSLWISHFYIFKKLLSGDSI